MTKFLMPEAKSSFTPVPEGAHVGTLVRIVDLGTHHNEMFDKDQRKVELCWETPDERASDGNPMLVGGIWNVSSSEKSGLTKLLRTWQRIEEVGGFDLSLLLGKGGILSVKHNTRGDKTFANVEAVMPLMKGQQTPPPVHPLVMFSMMDGTLDFETFGKLPEYLRKKIMESREYQEIMGQDLSGADVPFYDERVGY